GPEPAPRGGARVRGAAMSPGRDEVVLDRLEGGDLVPGPEVLEVDPASRRQERVVARRDDPPRPARPQLEDRLCPALDHAEGRPRARLGVDRERPGTQAIPVEPRHRDPLARVGIDDERLADDALVEAVLGELDDLVPDRRRLLLVDAVLAAALDELGAVLLHE